MWDFRKFRQFADFNYPRLTTQTINRSQRHFTPKNRYFSWYSAVQKQFRQFWKRLKIFKLFTLNQKILPWSVASCRQIKKWGGGICKNFIYRLVIWFLYHTVSIIQILYIMQNRASYKIMHRHTKQHLKPHHIVFNTTFLPASNHNRKMTSSHK